MGRKRKLKVDEQTKAKKPKIEVKEAKEVPLEDNEDERIEDEKPVKKPKKKYVYTPRPIDGDPKSNFLCEKFLSLFQELIKGNLDIKLEELEKVTCGSGRIFNWECLNHKSCKKHVWKASVCNRVKGNGCPYCCKFGGNKRWCPCDRPSFINEDGSYKRGKENMKRCTKCMEEKPKCEFNANKSNKNGFHSWCTECANEQSSFSSAMIRLYLQGKFCQDCGEQNDVVLEFDHVNNDKAKTRNGKTKIMILQSPENLCLEIKKTEIVCISCHRLRTFSRHTGKADESKESAQKRELAKKLKLERKCCLHCETQITKDTTRLFDCDHIDPATKIAAVSEMIIRSQFNLNDVEAEMAKCQLLCCSCHRIKTAKDGNWRKLSDFLPEIIAKARAFLDKHFVTDPEGNYIHVKPTKIESVKIHDKPAKPLKVKSTENLRALMSALSNQEAVSKNSIIIKPN